MGIDADVHVEAGLVTDVVDELDVTVRLEIAHGQLDDPEGLVLHERLHVLGIGVEGHLVLAVDVREAAPGVGRDGDLRDHGRVEFEDLAQVPIEGLAGDLAGQVPVGQAH